jgi:hypothetical protein
MGVCPREVHATVEDFRLGLARFFFFFFFFGPGQVGGKMQQKGN